MKFDCPSCNENCISLWQKAWADRFLPGKCVICGIRFYKPLAPQMNYLLWAMLIMLPIFAAVVYYSQPYLLFLNVPIFLWAYGSAYKNTDIYKKVKHLKAINKSAMDTSFVSHAERDVFSTHHPLAKTLSQLPIQIMKYIIPLISMLLLSFSVESNELMDAIESGDTLRIRTALKNGESPNQEFPEHGGFKNMSPVVWAIKKKSPKALSVLLDAGANPNSTGGYFNTPAISMVVVTSSIKTPMMLEMIELLVKSDVDINALSKDNSGVLHSAAYTSRPEAIELLLKRGADKSVVNKDGQTAHDIAKMFDNDDVLSLLK